MNLKNKIPGLIALSILCASCRVGKEYKQPAIETVSSFRSAQNSTKKNDTTNMAAIPWRTFFTDPALQQIIDSVLHKNYDMSVALNSVRITQEYVKQAKVEWLPSVTAGIYAGSNRFSDNSLNGANGFNVDRLIGKDRIEDYSANLGLSWEIDVWGKMKYQKQAALSSWLQSREAASALKTQLIRASASAYYNLLMLHKQLEIAHHNLSLNDSVVNFIRLQTENGEATVLALQQASVQQKATASVIPVLEQALQIQENALHLLMAGQADSIHVSAELNSFTVPEKFATGVPAQLLSHRPDVREQEYALRATNARVGIAQANMYPAFRITASGGLNTFLLTNWLSLPASLFGNLAGNLVQPVFNKRRLKRQLNTSRLEYEQAVSRFKHQMLKAATEVSDALITCEKLKDKMEISTSQNAILKQSMPAVKLLYAQGMANYLEIISIERNLLQNELELADLKRQQITAYIQLYRSLGGGTE